MKLTFRPLTLWPGQLTSPRKASPFKAGYSDTLQLLDRELRHLGASGAILQVAVTEEDVRLDGQVRRDARPAHPGVILTFDSKHGQLSYPCDTFGTWQANLRAIALALEHLRTVQRYGVGQRGEQYRGWQQLPNRAAPAMSSEDALSFLHRHLPGEESRDAYRKLAMRWHPDRNPGDEDAAANFKRLQQAKQALGF